MSKNTERGIGQQVGPAADGRPDDARPRHASETSTVGPASEPSDRDREGKASKVEVGQITLLGMAAPDLDREKATTPGRDVHLPTEVRRVAAPRSVSADTVPSPFTRDLRKTPESPRARVTPASASSFPLQTQDALSTVNARSTELGETPGAGSRAARRRDFAETTLMDAVPESGRGGSIALGIAISLVTAAVVVWTLRFGPHLRGFDATLAERPSSPSELERTRPGAPPPAREGRLPSPSGATPPSTEGGEPFGSNPIAEPGARRLPPSGETSGARGTPLDDGTAASRGGLDSASREPRLGAPSAGALDPTEEDGRRKPQRPRTAAPGERIGERIGERSGSFPTTPRRLPPPSNVRVGEVPAQLPPPSPPVGREATSEPPRFEPAASPPPPPAATPARPAPANEKQQYDPDSPLPPAAGE